MMSLLGEDLAHADNPILTALTSYMSWCNPPLFVWPLTSPHRDSPAAGHRVWWQGVVPGGEGASDGCCAYGTQCKCVHHLRGAWQPQLAGKWRKTWPYYSLNLYTMCKLTMVLCCAAGLHTGHQGAHIQRAGRTARDPLLHGRVPLPLLRHPARCQRLAGDPERRTQTVVWASHGSRPVDQWEAIFHRMGGVGSNQLHNAALLLASQPQQKD